MDEAIQVGDVVRLKSGGPDMTVAEINGGRAGCCWFSHSGDGVRFPVHHYCEHLFPLAALELCRMEGVEA